MSEQDKTTINNLLNRVLSRAKSHFAQHTDKGEVVETITVDSVKDRLSSQKSVVFKVKITTNVCQYEVWVAVDFFVGTIAVME